MIFLHSAYLGKYLSVCLFIYLVCVCRNQRTTSAVAPQEPSTLLFETKSLIGLYLSGIIKWPANELLSTVITTSIPCSLYTGSGGLAQFLCLQDKYFIKWVNHPNSVDLLIFTIFQTGSHLAQAGWEHVI